MPSRTTARAARQERIRAFARRASQNHLLRSVLHRALAECGNCAPWLVQWPKLASLAYRGYYRMLECTPPLSSGDGSLRSIPLADEDFRRFQAGLREALCEVAAPALAKQLNGTLAQIECQRGLGKTASLPTSWVIEPRGVGSQLTEKFLGHLPLAAAQEVTVVLSKASDLPVLHAVRERLVEAADTKVKLVCNIEALEPLLNDATALDELDLHKIVLLFPARPMAANEERLLESFSSHVRSCARADGTPLQLIWQIVLHRANLCELPRHADRAARLRPARIELFFERAWTPDEVQRSVFFARSDVEQQVRSFAQVCANFGVEVAVPWKETNPESTQRENAHAFGCIHVAGDGLLFPCGEHFSFHGTGWQAAWDSETWARYRQEASRGALRRDCYPCQIHARRNVWDVDYLLACYENNAPSQDYLDAVRSALDAVEDIALARQLNAAIRHHEHARGLERVASYPHRMYIEVTDECNLRCPMCTQTVLVGPRKRIAPELFEKVRPLMRYMDLIHFTGCGETFLHPHLMEMLEAVPHEHCAVRIITNGILLDENTARRLVTMGLHELWVSVDGTDAATFEKIRGSKLFDRVLHNIRTLTRLRRELGSQRPRVALNFVAQRSNIEQLPRFVRMAKELGADAVNVGFLQVYSRDLLAESLYFYQELSDACMAEAQRAAQEVGIELYIPGFFHERGDAVTVSRSEIVAPGAEPIKCVEPYGFVLVHADGSLGPCCVNDSRLGSLSTHDFVALWNGELYADFRRRVSTPEQDFDCEHCMLEGYKDIHEFEHHAKLFDENYRRAEVDYAALEQEVREQIAQGG